MARFSTLVIALPGTRRCYGRSSSVDVAEMRTRRTATAKHAKESGLFFEQVGWHIPHICAGTVHICAGEVACARWLGMRATQCRFGAIGAAAGRERRLEAVRRDGWCDGP